MLLVLLIILLVLGLGGGGYYGYSRGYHERPYLGGLWLVLLVLVIFLLFGGLRG